MGPARPFVRSFRRPRDLLGPRPRGPVEGQRRTRLGEGETLRVVRVPQSPFGHRKGPLSRLAATGCG